MPGWKGFIAVIFAIGAVLVFMVPLFVVNGASGVAYRRHRRVYHCDPYGDDDY